LGLRQPGEQRQTPVLILLRLPRVHPAALKAAKITGKVGWHTFCHSFATILKSHGEDVKTVQELLRHANSSITLNRHAQAVADTKRTAQSKIARLVFDAGKPLEQYFWLNGRYRTVETMEAFPLMH
jgi:integrase